ncbi:hypothetical protein [Methylomonas sp. 2B]
MIGGAMPVWNWAVNPYQIFENDQSFAEPYTSPATNERYLKVRYLLGAISANREKPAIDCLLVGSSVMGLLDPRLFKTYFPDSQCYNLAFLAGRPGEILATLQALIAHGLPIRRVVYGLEPFAFSDPVSEGPANRLHPIVTGAARWKFYLDYLFEPSLGDGIGTLFDALNRTVSVRYHVDEDGRYELVRYDKAIRTDEAQYVQQTFEQGRGPNRLVKNPPIFLLTHDVRDFFELKSVMTSSFKRFAPVSRAFYSPEAVCGRFSGELHPRRAHSTPVSA